MKKYIVFLLSLLPLYTMAQKASVLPDSSGHMLQEHTVSSKLPERTVGVGPVPVEIFSRQFFQKTQVKNLFESVQLINGVQAVINCNVCNTGSVQINGLEGPYTLVLIDGMPMISALSAVYGLSSIPLGMTDRLEVLKGPAAALYGSEAMAGSINVITRNAGAKPMLFADYSLSSYLENNLDLGWQFRHKKLGYLLSASLGSYQQRKDLNKDNFTDLALYQRASVFAKVQWVRRENLSSNFAMRFYTENRLGGQLNWEPQFRGGDSVYGESVYTRRAEWMALHPFMLGSEKFRFQQSWFIHHQNSAYGNKMFIATQTTGFNQLVYEKNIGARQRILSGATLRIQTYDDNTAATVYQQPGSVSYIPGFFFQDEWQPASRHTLLPGIRLDHYDVHGWVLSPRLHYRFEPFKNHTLRFSGGKGFRVVNVFTEDHAALNGSRQVVIEQGLKPEQSINFNLQYSNWINLKKGMADWDISLFYASFSNRIQPNYDADPNKIIYANSADQSFSRGVSVNMGYDFIFPLGIDAGFTLMQVLSTFKDTAGNLIRQQQIQAPRYTGNFQLAYEWKKQNLKFDITGLLYGPMRMPVQAHDYRPEWSPVYSLWNLQVKKTIKQDWEIYAGIKNILNYLPAHALMRPFDPFDKQAGNVQENPQGYTFDTTYSYAPLQGRNFYAGIRMKIGL